MGAAGLHVPVPGSNISAFARTLLLPCPPVTNTFPFGRRVAVCTFLESAKLPVSLQRVEAAARTGLSIPPVIMSEITKIVARRKGKADKVNLVFIKNPFI
jgi:hypothetical protein